MNSDTLQRWLQSHSTPAKGSYYQHKPLIMGVLNITPDSFSDGGRYWNPEKAFEHAVRLIAAGADILDVGGESSRPGAQAVSVQEELARVIPVIERVRSHADVVISIDTRKAEVMKAAVNEGASLINDITALQAPDSLEVAARLAVPVCLMHMQGKPDSMQDNPQYAAGVVAAVQQFFEERIRVCLAAGILREHIILDPGFGFGKTVQHNLQLLNSLSELQVHGLPVLLGVSRKSTLGAILNKKEDQRLYGGLAAAVFAVLHGASLIRTHDVEETKQTLDMVHAIQTVALSPCADKE